MQQSRIEAGDDRLAASPLIGKHQVASLTALQVFFTLMAMNTEQRGCAGLIGGWELACEL
jgi:hypothetical protein